MNDSRIVVLKFGSSVLRTPDDVPCAVHEVYRWVRQGYRVVAVVSAFEGETDRLMKEARAWSDRPPSSAAALLVSTGELRSAAHVAICLERAGIDAQVLDHAAIDLRTDGGPALDAAPRRFDVCKLRRVLCRWPVVVLPGYLGRDPLGRTTLLGRGGSDCSALFLADGLGARCRLIKDVDGLYEWDPQLGKTEPRRYQRLTWNSALELDGGIVQHKAISVARRQRQTFEVGGLLRDDATEVGAGPNRFVAAASPTRPLRVALLGLGSVGLGVYQAICRLPDRFEIVGVAVRDLSSDRNVPRHLLHGDLSSCLQTPCDVVVELTGADEPARKAIGWALQQGKPVVTANKRIVAAHGAGLEAMAREHGTTIRWSAACGGAVPILERLQQWHSRSEELRIDAVLNGTTNFVLDLWQQGLSWTEALAEARDGGFAEANPQRDISGEDAADKLILIHRTLTGQWLSTEKVEREPLRYQELDDIPPADRPILRQVATWEDCGRGHQLAVRIRRLSSRHPLARIRREENGVLLRDASGGREFLRGKGAGRWPTTQSVLADLLEVARPEESLPVDALVSDELPLNAEVVH